MLVKYREKRLENGPDAENAVGAFYIICMAMNKRLDMFNETGKRI